MSLASGKHRNEEKFTRLVAQLDTALERRYSYSAVTGAAFIHPDEVEEIISPRQVHKLLDQHPWYENNSEDLWDDMRLIICVLISIGWDSWYRWDQFATIFFDGPARIENVKIKDSNLPVHVDEFPALSSDALRLFQTKQFIFAPIVIEQGSRRVYTESYRIPIVERAFSDIMKKDLESVTIAPGFLRFADGSTNHIPQVMAYRCIRAKDTTEAVDLSAQQEVLDLMARNIEHHTNIMQNFASFIHGMSLVILSPDETINLSRLLEQPETVENTFPGRSFDFSPHTLLTEVYMVADALQFLHFELADQIGYFVQYIHQNLQPDSIIVDLGQAEPSSPVGRWMISDFDLADTGNPINLPQPLGRKPSSSFQPPEAEYRTSRTEGTKRDAWAYGCVLMSVLAFALGGPREVEEQRRARAIGTDDYFYHRTPVQPGEPGVSLSATMAAAVKLKPGVDNWLTGLRLLWGSSPHGQWVIPCAELIFRLTKTSVTERSSLKDACDTLASIRQTTKNVANECLWATAASLTARKRRSKDMVAGDSRIHDQDSSDVTDSVGLESLTLTGDGHSGLTDSDLDVVIRKLENEQRDIDARIRVLKAEREALHRVRIDGQEDGKLPKGEQSREQALSQTGDFIQEDRHAKQVSDITRDKEHKTHLQSYETKLSTSESIPQPFENVGERPRALSIRITDELGESTGATVSSPREDTPNPTGDEVVSSTSNQDTMSHTDDIHLEMTFDIEEDVVAELEEFVRLARLQIVEEADWMLQEVLLPHVGWFPVFAECAEYLLGPPVRPWPLGKLLDAAADSNFTAEEEDFRRLVVRICSSDDQDRGFAIRLLDIGRHSNGRLTPVAAQTIETVLVHSEMLLPAIDPYKDFMMYFEDALEAGELWSALRVFPSGAAHSNKMATMLMAIRDSCDAHEDRDLAELVLCIANLYVAEALVGHTSNEPLTQLQMYDLLLRVGPQLQRLLEGRKEGDLFKKWTAYVWLAIQDTVKWVSGNVATGASQNAEPLRRLGILSRQVSCVQRSVWSPAGVSTWDWYASSITEARGILQVYLETSSGNVPVPQGTGTEAVS